MQISKMVFSLLSCLLMFFAANAQEDYKGKVVDAYSGEAIPYVNIGIVEKGIGTVSDEEGLFHLYIQDNKDFSKEVVLFSALGYKTLNIPLNQIPLVYNAYPVFKMNPERISLNEVVVSNKGDRFISDIIGYKNYGEASYGYWKDKAALGGELATRVIAKSGLRRLNRFQFQVAYNSADSLLMRVNIYEDDGVMGSPRTNLNASGKNILVTIKKGEKNVWVDLKPFNIYVDGDFMVSLELLKVFSDKDLVLLLAAAFNKYGSYRKYASQDKWERVSDQNMAYLLETDLMVSEKVAQRLEKKEARKKKKQRLISGFTLQKGKMISGVEVTNTRTYETVFSDEKGKYLIAADKKDRVLFKKDGFKTMVLTVGDKPTANIIMKRE